MSVAFSPDGTRLLSGSRDKKLRLWPAPKAWPNILCAKLSRNMSRQEWREQVSPDIEYQEQCPGLPIPPDAPEQQPTTVGAGDSMVAGIVLYLAANKNIKEAVRFGVACGTAATLNEGTQLCKIEDAEKIYRAIQTL